MVALRYRVISRCYAEDLIRFIESGPCAAMLRKDQNAQALAIDMRAQLANPELAEVRVLRARLSALEFKTRAYSPGAMVVMFLMVLLTIGFTIWIIPIALSMTPQNASEHTDLVLVATIGGVVCLWLMHVLSKRRMPRRR